MEPIEPIPPPPTPTAATVEEKSDPPWYECVLSIDCLKKKAENTVDSLLEKGKQLLIDDFHERFQKVSQQCNEFSLICLSKEMAIGATADTLHISNPLMGLFSGIVDHFTGINPIEEMVHFVVDHPVFSLVTVASIVLAFFFPAIGVPMLLGGLVSGGTSYLMGNDWETILRDTWIGELAGLAGFGGYFRLPVP